MSNRVLSKRFRWLAIGIAAVLVLALLYLWVMSTQLRPLL
jgi:uncharacterized membrane protein YukC